MRTRFLQTCVVSTLAVLVSVGLFLPAASASPAASVPQGGAPVARSGGAGFYLALGDSVAVGYEPGKGQNTGYGYVDDLWRSVRHRDPGLALRNIACVGETTVSMITGKASHCRYPGTQLDRAVSFLHAHPGKVSLVTITLGSNDLFNRCVDFHNYKLNRACTVKLRHTVTRRLTWIVDALRQAAGPGVPIVAMKYYNPLLGLWGLVPGGRKLAHSNQRAWAVFNTWLANAYKGAGAAVANVAATFQINDFKDTVVVPGRGRLPVNVARTCTWTWFCSHKHTGDPHPNRTGYKMIARTFERELKRSA